MHTSPLKIGTRESQLAVWQATHVQQMLQQQGIVAELVYIKSEGDIDLQTPLYEMNVQGIFTRSLDIALLNKRIDIAVHSMKDVPTQLPKGIVQSAVLQRASHKDLLVPKAVSTNGAEPHTNLQDDPDEIENMLQSMPAIIATSSIRRKAQWLHRYPHHSIENLRGNINTRLRKVNDSDWHGAIFAAAGLDRIHLRPPNAIELDWMLPAPAQGAIMVVCRENDAVAQSACVPLNHSDTAICTKIERDFLRTLLGGCSTPISALARVTDSNIVFQGNILSVDGKQKVSIEKILSTLVAIDAGKLLAEELLLNGGQTIAESIYNGK